MTKQIHDGVRRNRRWVVALAAAGSLAAALIFLVIPAFGSPAGSGVPPASLQLGVVPTDVATGGQSNDCAVFNSPGSAQIRFANPKTGVTNYTIGGIAVSVSLTMNPPNANYPKTTDPGYDASKYPGSHNDGKWPAYGNDKYVSVTVTGAKLADIGVKGGTDTTRYNYVGQANSTGDTYLHGPAQSVVSASDPTPTQLYSVSNLTLCLRFGSASGTVYNDANPLPNGTYDSPPDTPLPGWTVRLYKGVTPGTAGGGSLVATTTSATDGTYSLSTSFDTGLWYRVCEAPPAGTWAQSQPLPNSVTLCTGAGEKAKGYDFKPAAATEQVGGKDFGNVPAGPCQAPFNTTNGTISYTALLAGACKQNTFVQSSGFVADTTIPYVSIWAGDQTKPKVGMVEKITFPYPVNAQNDVELRYDDVFPFSPNQAVAMLQCNLDPRNANAPANKDLSLLPSYDGLDASLNPYADPAAAQAEFNLVLPAGETSCYITATEQVDGSGVRQYVVYVYSSIDGFRDGF